MDRDRLLRLLQAAEQNVYDIEQLMSRHKTLVEQLSASGIDAGDSHEVTAWFEQLLSLSNAQYDRVWRDLYGSEPDKA